MIAYKTTNWNPTKIEEKEIIEFGEKSIFYLVNGKKRRDAIISGYAKYHRTKEDAISFLKKQAAEELERAKDEVVYAQSLVNMLNETYP